MNNKKTKNKFNRWMIALGFTSMFGLCAIAETLNYKYNAVKADTTTYTNFLTLNQSASTNNQNGGTFNKDPSITTPMKVDYMKQNWAGNFTSMYARATTYRQICKTGYEQEDLYIFKSDLNTNAKTWYSTYVIALAITPYNINVDVEGKYTMNLNIAIDDFNFVGNEYLNSFTLQTDVYTSLENGWANIINRADYAQNLNVIMQQYIGPSNAYTYSNQTYTKTIAEGESVNDMIIPVEIVPNNNNYILIQNTLIATYALDPYDNPNWNVTKEYAYLTRSNENYSVMPGITNIRISGTMLIPEGTTEVVDIPGMMFDILGMPFTFVSIAFDLTLFPGTPYSVNIGNLMLSILGCVIILWIMSLILKR